MPGFFCELSDPSTWPGFYQVTGLLSLHYRFFISLFLDGSNKCFSGFSFPFYLAVCACVSVHACACVRECVCVCVCVCVFVC